MKSMQRAPGPGIQVLEAEKPNGTWIVSAVGLGSGRCPDCESLSTSRHSRYVRHLQDLTVQGITVTLRVKLSGGDAATEDASVRPFPTCFRGSPSLLPDEPGG
jgi:hypothetical protein